MVNTASKKRPRGNSPSEESESENEFQVEAIVDKRTRGKKIQYFLKWKGYSEADNTWEDKNNLNCPELVKAFEESLKKKTKETKSGNKTKTKRTTKSKKAKVEESGEEEQSEEETENGHETTHNEENETELNGTNDTSVADVTTNGDEETSPPAKSRLRSTSKSESANGEITEEKKDSDQLETTNGDDEEEKRTSIELLPKSSPTKEDLPNEPLTDPPVNLRLRITPSSNSPISLTLNDSDNNNNTNEKTSMENSNNLSHDNDPLEIINEDEEPIEKIEGVKNGQDGLVFQVKLSGEKEAQWIPAKVANRKYPQAVIAFWEDHVEFT